MEAWETRFSQTICHEGFKIRDIRKLVPWQIAVQSIESDVATLRFSTLDNYTDRVLTPRFLIQLIEGEHNSVYSENPYPTGKHQYRFNRPQAAEIEIPSGETIIPIIRADSSDDLGNNSKDRLQR